MISYFIQFHPPSLLQSPSCKKAWINQPVRSSWENKAEKPNGEGHSKQTPCLSGTAFRLKHILERKFGKQEVPSLLQIESYLCNKSSYNLDSVGFTGIVKPLSLTLEGPSSRSPTSLSRHVHLLSNWVPYSPLGQLHQHLLATAVSWMVDMKLYHFSGIEIEPWSLEPDYLLYTGGCITYLS